MQPKYGRAESLSLVILLWSHNLNLYTILPPTYINSLLNNPAPLQLNFGAGLYTIAPCDVIVSNLTQYILSPI